MATASLDPDDRTFFRRLNRILFTNPFAVEPREIGELIGAEPVADHRAPHLFTELIPTVKARFQRLAGRGHDTVRPFHGEDRELLEHAQLFLVYHRFVTDLDRLIAAELDSGKPEPVGFARAVLGALTERGFSERAAQRHLGLFWQLRRAYHFIDSGLLGTSASMKRLRHGLWNNVFTHDARVYDRYLWNRMEDFSTVLLGETGTGKGQAAAAIGRSGYIPFDERAGRFRASFTASFIAINLSEYPETLIESELFGHRKGAFTGAVDNHQGVFERCSEHGALLLDEIGDASLGVQIKLLRVLQDREFTPVGSHTPQRFAGRVIAATHQRLDELRQAGRFRDDFFYRLSADIITVPTLRERLREAPEELPLLVDFLITRMTGQPAPALTELVLEVLRRDLPADYAWPGNVRELAQAVRRALLTRQYRGEPPRAGGDGFLAQLAAGDLDARAVLAGYCRLLYGRLGSYEAVARQTGLDRRTVKKYLQDSEL